MRTQTLITAIALLLLAACKSDNMTHADLILNNGTILTMDSSLPQAEALAVKDGKLLAVGTERDILLYKGPNTEMIDLDGATAMPGLIEGHGHFLMLGRQKLNIDLLDTRSYQDVLDSVAARAARTPEGHWIQGRGWHQEKWADTPATVLGFPTHQALSAISPEHPVYLDHASGHAILANARAMELAGITDATPDPPGGRIIRDADGKATGVFEERAENMVRAALDRWKAERDEATIEAEWMESLRLAAAECHRYGITSFHDAASTFEDINKLKKLDREGKLPIRLYLMIYEPWEAMKDRLGDYLLIQPEGFLTVRAIKQFYDGALGSRGALLLEDYADEPGHRGQTTLDTSDYHAMVRAAIAQGFQLCTHAIGDRANREVLDMYESIFATNPAATDPRWRIEHAQHLHPDDVPRFAALGVIASMQSVHCISDAPFVPRRLGEARAANGAYLWRSLLDSGARLMEGTDVPVERIDPFANIYAAVTRKVGSGTPFYPAQAKSRKEALEAYTQHNAWGAFEEHTKGQLKTGMLADIAVFDRNLLTCPEDSIAGTRVRYTIVGGKVGYRGKE